MLLFFLWYVGGLTNPPGPFLTGLELSHEVPSLIQQWTHYAARQLPMRAWPTIILSTEQSAQLGMMIPLITKPKQHFFWIAPNFQERDADLLWDKRSTQGNTNPFYSFRASIGGGYRYRFAPQGMMGLYGYYDYERDSTIGHIVSIGGELLLPTGVRLIGNVYVNLKPSEFFSLSSTINDFRGGWDIKAAANWRNSTLSFGGFYKLEESIFPIHAAGNGIAFSGPAPHNIYGVVAECHYTHRLKTYGIKYTYDTQNYHRLSFTFQWRLSQLPSSAYSDQPNSQILQLPVERYVAPYVSYIRHGNRRAQQAAEESCRQRENIERAQKVGENVQHFVNTFTQKVADTHSPLSTAGKQLLKPFNAWGNIIPTQVPLTHVVTQPLLLEQLSLQEHLSLSELYRYRSFIEQLIWLGIVYQAREDTEIELTMLDNSSTIILDDRNQLRVPRSQLDLLIQFGELTKYYFTKEQLDELDAMQNSPQASWKVTELRTSRRTINRSGVYSYKFPGLGQRLTSLHLMATSLQGYQSIIHKTGAITTSTLQAIHETLQIHIVAYLKGKCTALALTDSHSLRHNLLYFSSFIPKCTESTPEDRREKIKETAKLVKAIAQLPPELRAIIMRHFLEYRLCDSVLDYGRTNLLKRHFGRLPFLSWDTSISKKDDWLEQLIAVYVPRLVPYLFSIQSHEEVESYLKIPHNEYNYF
jgi:hypothetical protein